jgi:hypothetical protein
MRPLIAIQLDIDKKTRSFKDNNNNAKLGANVKLAPELAAQDTRKLREARVLRGKHTINR